MHLARKLGVLLSCSAVGGGRQGAVDAFSAAQGSRVVGLRSSALRQSMHLEEEFAAPTGVGKDDLTDVMGRLPEREYAPKEGENDAGGGQRLKMILELAKSQHEATGETTGAAAAPGATTTITPQYDGQAPPPPTNLPSDWASTVDAASGRTYYYNRATGETSWAPNAAVVAAATTTRTPQYDQALPPTGLLPPGWASAVDPASSRTYYYSRATGETTWAPPPMPHPSAARSQLAPSPPSSLNAQAETSKIPGGKAGLQDVESVRKELHSSQLQMKELKAQLDEARKEIARLNEENDRLRGSFPSSEGKDNTASNDGTNKTSGEHETERESGKKISGSIGDHKENDKASFLEDSAAREENDVANESSTAETISVEGAASNTDKSSDEEDEEDQSQESNDEVRAVAEQPMTKAKTDVPTLGDELRTAAWKMNATRVSALLEAGLEMDKATTEAAFWAVVKAIDRAEEEDKPLSADVPRMLHHIFDADLRHLLSREKLTTNVTCMQPAETGLTKHGMNYIFDDSSHKDLPLTEGRRCEDGTCCDKCSRNIFPTFATDAECSLDTFPELASLTFNDLESVATATILQFTRLIERVRRTIAHEYGLPLSSILPLQAYSRKYVAGTTQQGGGGGEGDFVTLHTDEATHSGYHYSCVIYLSTQGEDFEGGDFVFNDPAKKTNSAPSEREEKDNDGDEPVMSLAEQIRRAGRELTPYHPTRGAAVIFSSGWENMHEVERVTSGTRYAVPCFFTTCPVPEAAYEQMVAGKPKTDEDIADDWLHLLLAHRQETPIQSMGRVKELLMKWHYMCAPLSEH